MALGAVVVAAVGLPGVLGVGASIRGNVPVGDLLNAVTSAKAVYTQTGMYPTTASMVQSLSTVEPELGFASGPVTFGLVPHVTVSVAVGNTGNILLLSVQGRAGKCAYAEDNESAFGTLSTEGLAGATYYLGVHYAMTPGPEAQCSASAPAANLDWGPCFAATCPGTTTLQDELLMLVWTGQGLYLPGRSYESTTQLISFVSPYVPSISLQSGPVTYHAGPPSPVSVVVSTDGQVALYALPLAGGHCVYLETNQNPTSHPSTSGLSGATPVPGTHYATSPRAEPDCSAGDPVTGLVWSITAPAG